jgi:hypothetical protein
MPPAPPIAKPNRIPRLLITIAVLAGVTVFGMILTFSAWRWSLAEDINAKTAAIKAAGLPADWQDLTNWPTSIPDSENAAFIYKDAIAHLDRDSIESITNIDDTAQLRRTISATMRAHFELIVKNNSRALAIITQVTNAGKSRYPVNFLDGPNMELPHLEGLKKLALVLEYDAILEAEDSNAPGASDDVSSILKLSKSLDNEPVLISQLTSVAILAISCETFEAVLSHMPLPDAQLAKLEPQFAAAEATNRILTGVIGERALQNGLLRLALDDPQKFIDMGPTSGDGDDGEIKLPHNPGIGWKILGLFERDRDFYLNAMTTNILLIAQGPPASLALPEEDNRLSDEAANNLDVFSGMLLQVMGGVAQRDARNRARLRNAIAAIAVERWRSTHHIASLDSLKDLVPAFLLRVPADPYDGNPLRYKKLKKGYCIYSIGPNLRDDGGKEIPPLSVRETNPDWTNYDIVFTVER